ncbi:hypothetical protein BDN72DRAFT_844594 [Pluteus cervinus]|uniref:Uncharacterized protein n=1 Tax=Pluteus cervinus TaxID=181527 RepID=A0ACD3AMV3_9AGAR|nr:hypothetical protein BDN72DRAFT_844594 [Pluteus cervinus]
MSKHPLMSARGLSIVLDASNALEPSPQGTYAKVQALGLWASRFLNLARHKLKPSPRQRNIGSLPRPSSFGTRETSDEQHNIRYSGCTGIKSQLIKIRDW